jgi:hypothetical protein
MVYVSKNKINKINNQEHSKSVMVWVLDKDKLIKEQIMLVIKYNFNNKFKEIKINKKDKIMDKIINNNKMTLIWKANFKVKCMINKKIQMMKIINKDNKYLINKWVK